MAEFLVEAYLARLDEAAVEQLTRKGTPVRYLRAVFVPEDETCFHLYE